MIYTKDVRTVYGHAFRVSAVDVCTLSSAVIIPETRKNIYFFLGLLSLKINTEPVPNHRLSMHSSYSSRRKMMIE